MRILIVTQLFYPDTVGGSERVVYEHARGLAHRGHEVTVAVQRAHKDLLSEENIDGIRVIRYGHPKHRAFFGASFIDMTAGVSCMRRLISEQYDRVILHHPFPAKAYFKARGKMPGVPTLYVFHASVYRELLFQKKIKRRRVTQSIFGRLLGVVFTSLMLRYVRKVEESVIHSSSRIVVLSDFSKKLVQETFRVPDARIVKIPGGVDLEEYRPHPSVRALRIQLHLPQDRKIFLTVRRLVPRMGLEELLEAFAKLYRETAEIQLYIGGIGPEKYALKRLVQKLGITRIVTFLGFIPMRELPDYYAAADLFVLPTVAYEGFGIATLEALASGTPVLGTAVGATPELLGLVDPSLIVPSGTPDAIVQGLRQYLAKTPVEREELRKKARLVAETSFSWDRAVALLENTLIQLK